MNKKALILLLILTIPAYTFLIPTPKTATLNSIGTPQQENNIIIQSIDNRNNILTNGYQAPWQLKILWDSKHQGYWYSSKFSEMISDLENIYGANVTINNKLFNETDLTQYDLIVIPASSGNLTNEEILALRNYLENNGTLLLMGDRSAYYPEYLNATTLPYGIGWYNTTIYDDTNYDYKSYYPVVHVWKNNLVANYITGNNTGLEFKTSGCPIVVTGDNTTNKIYLIGIGDNDTYTDANISDGDIIYFAAVDLQNGGRIIASSGTSGFQDAYNYGNYGNNTYIALRIVGWLLSEGLEITEYTVPNELEINSEGYVTLTIRNNYEGTALNVKTAIEFDEGIEVLNGTQEYLIGNMTEGETVTIRWHVKAVSQTTVHVTLKVWSDNARGYSIATSFNTKGILMVETSLSHRYVLVPANVSFTVNVTNPEVSNTNTTANITVLAYYVEENLTETIYSEKNVTINAGDSYVFTVAIEVVNLTKATEVRLTVQVDSDALGSFSTMNNFYAFVRHVAIYYEHDVGYYTHSKFELFLGNISRYLDVFAMTDTLNSEILSFTDLIILPEPDHSMTAEELTLLKNWINNGGKIITIGDWYKYFNPETLNALTAEYGIIWNDGEIMDDVTNYNNKSYAPILSTFAKNPYGGYLGKNVESVIFHGSTYLILNESTAYPVVLGNPTSYAVDSNGKPVGVNGSNIIAFAVAEAPNGGLIIASGSTYVFRSDGSYISYYQHNKAFLMNILDLLFAGNFIFDTEPPTITFTTQGLKNFSCVPNQFALTWSATDNVEVSTINIYINGELITSLEGTATSYNFNLVDDGIYTIKVEAVDWLGYTDSFTIILIVDQAPPVITITSPSDGSTISSTSITLTWTVDDPAVPLVGHYAIYVDGTLVNNSIPGDATSYDLSGLEEGTHNITLVAFSCRTNSSASITVTVDLSGPTITFTPENGSEVSVPFTITANVSDPSGLDRYEISIDGSIVSSGTLSGTSTTITYTVEDLTPGSHTVTIKVYDSLGNYREVTFVITVSAPSGGLDPVVIGGAAIAIIAIIGIAFYFFRRGGA